ncbi:MAG TPA: hypothetical protein VNV43_12700 [Candidatus Acidoferrales bacterium]|jgi:hypothetical protein|nr:hypothetical protein [Candidatus Acidoferrales bacterium]
MRPTVSLEDLDTLFEGGKRQLARQRAVEELMELTDLGKSACYTVLKIVGRFVANLVEQDGLLSFKP